MKVKSVKRVQLLATPWTAAYQASLSMGFFHGSGLPLPSPISEWRQYWGPWPWCSRGLLEALMLGTHSSRWRDSVPARVILACLGQQCGLWVITHRVYHSLFSFTFHTNLSWRSIQFKLLQLSFSMIYSLLLKITVTWNNGLVPNWEGSTSRLYIVTLRI